ncbi:MAG: hypothetical protein AABY09_02220, partial [Nanoarchaeota archaeon]
MIFGKRGMMNKLGEKRNLALLLILILGATSVAWSQLIGAETLAGFDTANAIDTGLDTSYGVKLDFVEKGLTHKVLEIDLGSSRALNA